MKLTGFGIGLALLVAPGLAAAQAGNNADVLIDLSRERDNARQADPSGLTPLQRSLLPILQFQNLGQQPNKLCLSLWSNTFLTCQFQVIVPFTYTSNPLGTSDPTSDGHAKPDVSLHVATGNPANDMFVLSGYVDLSFNQYIINSTADADTLRLWLGASLTPIPKLPFSLYLGYRPILTYSWDFGERTAIFHDALAGINWITTPTVGIHPITLNFDLNGGHRTSDPSKFSGTFGALTLAASYRYCPQYDPDACAGSKPRPNSFPAWSIVAKPTVNMTWYDDNVGGESRRDVRPGFTVTALWWPWHARHDALSALSFVVQASFARNDSNIQNRSFTSWDVGPALKWTFGQNAGIEPSNRKLVTADGERR